MLVQVNTGLLQSTEHRAGVQSFLCLWLDLIIGGMSTLGSGMGSFLWSVGKDKRLAVSLYSEPFTLMRSEL